MTRGTFDPADYQGPPQALPIAQSLVEAGGGEIRAIVLFGSQLVRASPSAHSAWDFVVVVDAYGPFHRALVDAGHHRRPAWLLSAFARVLAPNITAFDPGNGAPLAKCAIVSSAHFERALAPGSPDHFLKGRMVQQLAVLWSRTAADRTWVDAQLSAARDDVLDWAGPSFDRPFTPAEYAQGFLRVSYGGEVRPESAGRVDAVFEAQRPYLAEAYADVLARAEAAGHVERVESAGGGEAGDAEGGDSSEPRYAIVPAPTDRDRRRQRRYFRRSKVRATLRWAKHIVTFNDWLTYIQRKVERRTGSKIEITPWERRLPLLLLWPKVFRVLASRGSSPAPEAVESSSPQQLEPPPEQLGSSPEALGSSPEPLEKGR